MAEQRDRQDRVRDLLGQLGVEYDMAPETEKKAIRDIVHKWVSHRAGWRTVQIDLKTKLAG